MILLSVNYRLLFPFVKIKLNTDFEKTGYQGPNNYYRPGPSYKILGAYLGA